MRDPSNFGKLDDVWLSLLTGSVLAASAAAVTGLAGALFPSVRSVPNFGFVSGLPFVFSFLLLFKGEIPTQIRVQALVLLLLGILGGAQAPESNDIVAFLLCAVGASIGV